MKIKLLIICLCLVVAAVGGTMSVNFTNSQENFEQKPTPASLELTNTKGPVDAK